MKGLIREDRYKDSPRKGGKNMSDEISMPKWKRSTKVGDPVVWHDENGNPHNALIICVFPAQESGMGLLNIMLPSPDENQEDSYGRQIHRETSCMHKSSSNVHGRYWRYLDEEPNPYVAPEQK